MSYAANSQLINVYIQICLVVSSVLQDHHKGCTPKSSISTAFSILNHPAMGITWGYLHDYGTPHINRKVHHQTATEYINMPVVFHDSVPILPATRNYPNLVGGAITILKNMSSPMGRMTSHI
jgi:hypothetical protein